MKFGGFYQYFSVIYQNSVIKNNKINCQLKWSPVWHSTTMDLFYSDIDFLRWNSEILTEKYMKNKLDITKFYKKNPNLSKVMAKNLNIGSTDGLELIL